MCGGRFLCRETSSGTVGFTVRNFLLTLSNSISLSEASCVVLVRRAKFGDLSSPFEANIFETLVAKKIR